MGRDFSDWLAEVPYTIPWWKRLFKALEKAPYRYFDRINTIVDYFEWSCSEKHIWFVTLFLPCLGKAALALLSTDWDDVARGFLRPYGTGGRKSLVFRPDAAKWEFEIPELGEEIGNRLPGAKVIKANKWWGKTRFLWEVDMAIQKYLYYWLIIDVVSELLFNYASAVLRQVDCYEGGIRIYDGYYGNPGGVGRYTVPLRTNIAKIEESPNAKPGVFVGSSSIVAHRPFKILIDVEFVPIFPLECRCSYRVSLRSKDGKKLVRSPLARSWQDDYKSPLFVARVGRPGEYSISVDVGYSTCITAAIAVNNVVIK